MALLDKNHDDVTVTQTNADTVTIYQARTKSLLEDLVKEQKLTNLYLSVMVGETFTIEDIEE